MQIFRWSAFCVYTVCAILTGFLLAGTVVGSTLPGFKNSPYFGEQVITFKLNPDMRIHINAPSPANFDDSKPVGLALFALPNGNTIEHTVGKALESGDDWHYDIQHIGAQTRFLREKISDYNLVTVYLEVKQLSWPTWKSTYPDYDDIIKNTVEYLKSYFRDYNPFVILTGHSGGGRFIFSYLDAFNEIPDYIDRICFLDSNYGYENVYGDKMIQWMNGASDRFISVLAYNDSVALYNGLPVVSPTGGTWYRSRMMQSYFANFYTFTTEEDDTFIRHSALNGRIKFFLKKNPEQKILHTVQVERNGFIHSILTGTPLENDGYTYYGDRIYTSLVQAEALPNRNFQIPLRAPHAMDGSQFMEYVRDMTFTDREQAILNELLTGNIPYFLRELKMLEANFEDTNGTSHQVEYQVFPDYLAIGSDSNYCRVPMGPITAQKAADFFGTCLPTRKLVDHIYQNAEIKVAPVTYAPVGNENESVQKFIEHNTAIENQIQAVGGTPGQLLGGTKKDVVLSNKIIDPARPDHVVIYGWHQLNGEPIQPLTNIHINTYVDYSHGIRYLDSEVKIDGTVRQVQAILKDALLYKILSDEAGAMSQPTYISDGSIPDKPKSFGLKVESDGVVKLLLNSVAEAEQYHLYTSKDGINFNPAIIFNSTEYTLTNLPIDSIIYIKLAAENSAGLSADSEVLAAIPKILDIPKMLMVYGFDRTSAGNTFDFIRQHAAAVLENGYTFESASNDAFINGLFNLDDYLVVDYILGDESTVDETFSSTEQALVSSYLKAGGRLFVSGAEIAWDLDYKGSISDKAFFNDYLKSEYSADAPGNVSGTYYSSFGTDGGIFELIDPINFDNGSQGTIDVKYADVLLPLGGSKEIITYKNVTSFTIGGISYEGTFKEGSQPGKLVYLGFPFETIYYAATRNLMMKRILAFLYSEISSLENMIRNIPASFHLGQNYPNPFNPTTSFIYQIPKESDISIIIYNSLGSKIRDWNYSDQVAGTHRISWNGTNEAGMRVSSGYYFYHMKTADFSKTKKMTLVR